MKRHEKVMLGMLVDIGIEIANYELDRHLAKAEQKRR